MKHTLLPTHLYVFFSYNAVEHKFIQLYMGARKEADNSALSAAIKCTKFDHIAGGMELTSPSSRTPRYWPFESHTQHTHTLVTGAASAPSTASLHLSRLMNSPTLLAFSSRTHEDCCTAIKLSHTDVHLLTMYQYYF